MKTLSEQRSWSLTDWLQHLERQHHKEIDLGLERISQVASALNARQPARTVITVAGTNGKGSTVRYLEQILLADGRSVASYTSPHFIDYRERVRINGTELADADHCAAFAAVEAARGSTSLTYFEFGTLAALWLIARQQVDVAVLEIGLGGRLDAVNMVEPDISVVTSVGIDHIDFLGDNREQIGFEKAGVYRAGKPAICADPEPPQRLVSHAEHIQARLLCIGRDYSWQLEPADAGWRFDYPGWSFRHLPMTSLPLANAATALSALAQLDQRPARSSIEQGLQQARLPGRLEVFRQHPLVVLDVAHNPHAAKYLAQQLRERWPQYRVRAVCAMLSDKDIAGTLECLTPLVERWYLAPTPGPRGAASDRLSSALQRLGQANDAQQSFTSIVNAYQSALTDAEEGDLVLCFGSFLTIQAIYQLEG
ncbi:MAG: bifunctional tetrahydrofolate synthase/dihydrofolate synthase [Gammaproteobacteria bacterium]|nr:bifunctional tetrahydrofolate synthase/dihydrofolate synthase [Gammaproteobacteria bacterium]